jgi:hypothetical protein
MIFHKEVFVLHGGTPIKNRSQMVEHFNGEVYIPYTRGRIYVRNNAILDLKIAKGKVKALVQNFNLNDFV